jgi:hypothetical protein
MSECIVGRCPGCHSLVFACVDDPKWKKETAKDVAQAIKDGLEISRVDTETVRVEMKGCSCNPNPRK